MTPRRRGPTKMQGKEGKEREKGKGQIKETLEWNKVTTILNHLLSH